MTREELLKILSAHFVQEITDTEKYLSLYKQIENHKNTYMVKGFKEIIKDEYSHVDFIKSILEEYDFTIPEDVKKKLDKLEEDIEDTF